MSLRRTEEGASKRNRAGFPGHTGHFGAGEYGVRENRYLSDISGLVGSSDPEERAWKSPEKSLGFGRLPPS